MSKNFTIAEERVELQNEGDFVGVLESSLVGKSETIYLGPYDDSGPGYVSLFGAI